MPESPAPPRVNAVPSRATVRLAFAALILANMSLALGPWMVRLSTVDDGGVGPIASGFWRLLLAAPMLVALSVAMRQPIRRLPGSTLPVLVLAGVLFAVDLALWHVGLRMTNMANATLFGNISSLMFPIYGFVIARAWPTQNQGVALGLGVVGAVLLMGRSYELSPQNLLGDLVCLAAGVFYFLYLIVIDRVRGVVSTWPLLALSTISGVLPMLAIAAIAGERLWPDQWTPLILLAFFSQTLGQGLLVYAMGYTKPIVVGLAFLTQPIVGGLIGFSFYGEVMTAIDLFGAAAIGTALVLVSQSRGRLPGSDAAADPR